MPTTSQTNFIVASQIALSKEIARIISLETVGVDVDKDKSKWFLANMLLDELIYFVNLAEEEQTCLSSEDICDMVRKLKDYLFACC